MLSPVEHGTGKCVSHEMRDYGRRILWQGADLKLCSELEYIRLRAGQLVIPVSNPDNGKDFIFSFTLRPAPSTFSLVPNGYLELFPLEVKPYDLSPPSGAGV